MSILSAITATEERYQERREERRENLAFIKSGQILSIATNTPAVVRRRMQRLHADPDYVLSLREKGLAFDPEGPGRAPQQFPRSLERVLDSNDLMGLRFFEQGLRVARAVARVHVRDERGAPLGYGTGFLVSPRLLLTTSTCSPAPSRPAAAWWSSTTRRTPAARSRPARSSPSPRRSCSSATRSTITP